MKIINKIKNNREYLLAFVIPLILTLLTFICLRVFLRNENTLFVSDLRAQYVALFAEFKDIMAGQSSLFYSFEKGIGGNMLGTIAYYLISPLNLLLLFFSKNNIDLAFVTILTAKISLAGLMMYVFLKYHFPKKKILYLLIFSTCYALMAFNVGYYFHIMWLDGVYLAPLVMLGLDKIIDQKSPLLYGVALFICLLTNFYIGYMICLFSVIYFFYKAALKYTLKDKQKILTALINFSVISLLAGLATFFLVIPALQELMQTPKLGTNVFVENPLVFNLNIFDIISKLYLGSQNNATILNDSSAYIYSGLIVIPLLIFYFLNRKITQREKNLTGIVLGIFILSFNINYLSYIWHGFNIPLCFNQRFSFLFSFFIIYLASQSFFKTEFLKKADYWLAAAICAVISIPVILLNYVYLDRYLVYATMGLIIFYLVIIHLFNDRNYEVKKNRVGLLLFCLIMAELFFNFYVSIKTYNFAPTNEYNDYNRVIGQAIQKIRKNDSSPFYRMEKNFSYTEIDSMNYNYNGVNVFISTLNSNVMNFYNNNAYSTFVNSVLYENTNPIIDSILGVKYVLFRNGTNSYYDKIDTVPFSKYDGIFYGAVKVDVQVTQNPNSLELGYMVNQDAVNFEEIFVRTPKINNMVFSDVMLKTMTGDQTDIMKPVNLTKIDNRNYIINVTDNNNIYAFFYSVLRKKTGKIEIYVDDVIVHSYHSTSNNFFIIPNDYKIGDQIRITAKEYNASIVVANPSLYYLDFATLNKKIATLKTNQLKVLVNQSDYIKGVVSATKEKPILFTSIPNEKGWTAYVDGKQVELIKLYSAFNGLKLTPGEHTIEFKFYPPGLKIGLITSFISMALAGIYFFKRKKITNFIIDFYNKHEEVIAYVIVGGLTTVVSLSSYIVFAKVFHINYFSSTVISWVIAVIFAYFADKYLVFKNQSKNITKEMLLFLQYRLISLAMDITIMYLLVSIFHINDIVARLVIQVIVITSNYFFSKLFIFNDK